MPPTILAIMANSGGTSKTTTATSLAHGLSLDGFKVCLLDLDPKRGLDQACGLLEVEDPSQTMAQVLAIPYHQEYPWPLTNVSWSPSVRVCQGHTALADISDRLAPEKRSHYRLSDRLEKWPIDCDYIIIDCPATLGILVTLALPAASHIIIPVRPDGNTSTLDGYLRWWLSNVNDLMLRPSPKIIGLLPTAYDKHTAAHRSSLEHLIEFGRIQELKVYDPIRYSRHMITAHLKGVPIGKYRPSESAWKDHLPLLGDVKKLRANL